MWFDVRKQSALRLFAAVLGAVLLCMAAFSQVAAVRAETEYDYIENGGFEEVGYSFGAQNFGKWYKYGGVSLSASSARSAAGSNSLQTTVTAAGGGVAYRLPYSAVGDGWLDGINHTLSFYIYSESALAIDVKFDLTMYSGGKHTNGYGVSVKVETIPNAWTPFELPFSIEKNGDKLHVVSGAEQAESGNGTLAAVDLYFTSGEVGVFYLDCVSFCPDIEDVDGGKTIPPSNGTATDIQGTGMLADSGFENGMFASSYSENLWSPCGAFTSLVSDTSFTYAGVRSMKIIGRASCDSAALIRMSMSGYFKDGKTYRFRSFVSSVSDTEVLFKVRVYGYDGSAYPSEYVPVSTVKTKSGEWSEMTGSLKISYLSSENAIKAETGKGVFYIEGVSGVSALEFYFCTSEGSQNASTALYIDNCYFSLLGTTVIPTENEVKREGETTVGNHDIFTTVTYTTKEQGMSLKTLGISIAAAIAAYIVFSVILKIYKRKARAKEDV